MGNATAIFNLMRNIGGSFGVALMTTFVARRSQFHQTRLVEHITPGDLRNQQMLEQMKYWFMSRGSDSATATRRALGAMYGEAQRHASMLSFVEAFWIMCLIFWGVVPLVALLRNPRKMDGKHGLDDHSPQAPRVAHAEEPELVHM
jgi:DHA2 family multidrug resistance protein